MACFLVQRWASLEKTQARRAPGRSSWDHSHSTFSEVVLYLFHCRLPTFFKVIELALKTVAGGSKPSSLVLLTVSSKLSATWGSSDRSFAGLKRNFASFHMSRQVLEGRTGAAEIVAVLGVEGGSCFQQRIKCCLVRFFVLDPTSS